MDPFCGDFVGNGIRHRKLCIGFPVGECSIDVSAVDDGDDFYRQCGVFCQSHQQRKGIRIRGCGNPEPVLRDGLGEGQCQTDGSKISEHGQSSHGLMVRPEQSFRHVLGSLLDVFQLLTDDQYRAVHLAEPLDAEQHGQNAAREAKKTDRRKPSLI